MIEEKIKDMSMTETYSIIQKHCSYNHKAYKVMMSNLCCGNDKGIPGIIFSSSW